MHSSLPPRGWRGRDIGAHGRDPRGAARGVPPVSGVDQGLPRWNRAPRRVTMDGVQESLDRAGAEPVTKAPGAPVLAAPKMYRRRTGRAIAGVASGLADHLGVKVVWVRAAFALLAALNGV